MYTHMNIVYALIDTTHKHCALLIRRDDIHIQFDIFLRNQIPLYQRIQIVQNRWHMSRTLRICLFRG